MKIFKLRISKLYVTTKKGTSKCTVKTPNIYLLMPDGWHFFEFRNFYYNDKSKLFFREPCETMMDFGNSVEASNLNHYLSWKESPYRRGIVLLRITTSKWEQSYSRPEQYYLTIYLTKIFHHFMNLFPPTRQPLKEWFC